MKYLIVKIISIFLSVIMLITSYIFWEDIKVVVKNTFEWVQEMKEKREIKDSASVSCLQYAEFVK